MRRLVLVALALILAVAASPARADDATSQTVTIMGATMVLEVPRPVIPTPAPPTEQPAAQAQTVSLVTPVPSYAGIVAALHSMTPEQLIRFLWPDNAENRMIAIAKRESGLRCNAKNPHSSAAGLFQTLSLHRARATRMHISWADITGPDCVADAFLAFAIWQDSGFAPWRL